jgi:hypothetical protein
MEMPEPSSFPPDLPLGMCSAYPGMPEQVPVDRKAVLKSLNGKNLDLVADVAIGDETRVLLMLQDAHRATGILPTTALTWGVSVAKGLATSAAVDEIGEWRNAASCLREENWQAKFEGVRDVIKPYVKGVQEHPENGTFEIGRWTIAVPRGSDFETRHMKFLIKDPSNYSGRCVA